MQLFTRRSWQGAALYATLLLGISGCRSAGDALSKDREIEELRYENARKRESIIASLTEAERARRALSDLETERTTLAKQVSDLGTSLRAATTELASVTTQRNDLRVKVADAEKSHERLQQSLEKVRSVAGASAGELTDLRLRNQELEESVKQLAERQGVLSEENKRFTREVEDLREELVRTRAVLRSIREGAPDKAGIAALEEQLQSLQRRNADLEGEKVALQKRVDALGGGASGASADGTASAAGGPGSSRNASSILWEIGGLVKERYEGALKGQFHWDSFDLILLGAIAVVLLFIYWVAIRSFRTRRLKKQVRALTARVVDLEHGGSGSRGSSQGDAEAGAVRGEGSSRVRKSPSMRRSGFTAVITNKEVQGKPAGHRPAESGREPRRIERAVPIVPEEERVLDGVLHGGMQAPPPARVPDHGREKSEPRKVIGARLWGDESEAASQDELANTQIINKVTVDDQAVELPTLSAKGSGAADPLRGAGPGKPRKDASEGDDLELLQELKAVINKKFDELMK